MEMRVEDYLDSTVFSYQPCTCPHQVQTSWVHHQHSQAIDVKKNKALFQQTSKFLFLKVFPIKNSKASIIVPFTNQYSTVRSSIKSLLQK